MRNFVSHICSVALAAVVGVALADVTPGQGVVAYAQGNKNFQKTVATPSVHESVLRIRDGQQLPMARVVTIARNKSLLVELPRELRDVIVSNPEMVDAVVQSANRVYLIGKKIGQANAFFFDAQGERVLTLEVQVEIDTRPLDHMFRRFIAGSNIRTEVLNDTLVLTGTVRNPADSSRAEALAARFANTLEPQNDQAPKEKVINMLVVEGEEQVTLQVKIAEVQREAMKQLGVNLGAGFQNGNGSGLTADSRTNCQ